MRALIILVFVLLSCSTITKAQIPYLVVTDTTGINWTLSSHISDDENTLLCFWADWNNISIWHLDSWMPYADDWQEHPCELNIVCIHLMSSFSDTNDVIDLWNEKGWPGQLFIADDGQAGNAFNFNGFPRTFLWDEEGDTLHNQTGWSNGAEVVLDSVIHANLCEEVIIIGEEETETSSFSVRQNHTSIHISSEEELFDRVQIFGLDGRLLFESRSENQHEMEILKTKLPKESMVVIRALSETSMFSQVLFID